MLQMVSHKTFKSAKKRPSENKKDRKNNTLKSWITQALNFQ